MTSSSKASPKQRRQRKLAWALYMCLGFRGCLKSIPGDIELYGIRRALDDLIHELYSSMERI